MVIANGTSFTPMNSKIMTGRPMTVRIMMRIQCSTGFVMIVPRPYKRMNNAMSPNAIHTFFLRGVKNPSLASGIFFVIEILSRVFLKV